jgi:hypothetical protein
MDYPACSMICAAEALGRLAVGAQAMGLDWRDFLPADQRPDLVPWDAWQTATKLHGKRVWRTTKTTI